jgi:hypothetical protein
MYITLDAYIRINITSVRVVFLFWLTTEYVQPAGKNNGQARGLAESTKWLVCIVNHCFLGVIQKTRNSALF